jgi:RimJ/RimL family protein N-acetyltransferase
MSEVSPLPQGWPTAELLETERLVLEPLRVDHAAEMAPLLDDERLHEYIGDAPATLRELHERYATLVAGWSSDGSEGWLNWIVRLRGEGVAVGYVQATLTRGADRLPSDKVMADVAWVIGVPYQGHGYARESAVAMVTWLRASGVDTVVAYVHPDHHASMGVARHLGLTATDEVVDGETRWIG